MLSHGSFTCFRFVAQWLRAKAIAGTIFNVELVDEKGVETRAVFFNKEVS